jgi:hypothetical protein
MVGSLPALYEKYANVHPHDRARNSIRREDLKVGSVDLPVI